MATIAPGKQMFFFRSKFPSTFRVCLLEIIMEAIDRMNGANMKYCFIVLCYIVSSRCCFAVLLLKGRVAKWSYYIDRYFLFGALSQIWNYNLCQHFVCALHICLYIYLSSCLSLRITELRVTNLSVIHTILRYHRSHWRNDFEKSCKHIMFLKNLHSYNNNDVLQRSYQRRETLL